MNYFLKFTILEKIMKMAILWGKGGAMRSIKINDFIL